MPVDVSVPAVINATGGLFFALLGAFALTVARGARRGTLVGALSLTFGVEKVVENLWIQETLANLVVAVLHLAVFALTLALARDLLRDVAVPRTVALAFIALCLVCATLWIWGAIVFYRLDVVGQFFGHLSPEVKRTFYIAIFGSNLATIGFFALVGVCALAAAQAPPSEARSLMLLAAALGGFAMWITAPWGIPREGEVLYLAYWASAIGLVAFWAYATLGQEPKLGRTTLLTILAFGLASILFNSTWRRVASLDPLLDYGAPGVVRTIGALLLSIAIFRYDLLRVDLPRFTARRGPLAAGAFALLIIVAQVAQNFFAAQYGLLLGGVVAGAFLFAAQPLQRIIEGATRGGAGTVRATTSDAENERVYRVTLRKYLADATVSRDEEVALMHLADELGISARRAVELRHEIEGAP